MLTDAELLQRYVGGNSEAAFRELVTRHLPLVYSAALRQLAGDTHLAQDVAQTVFTALARKAATLTAHASLAGWLYLGTHHAAAQAVRANRRRTAREQKAYIMDAELAPETSAADWERVRPVLDAAMRELSETDREAVLLRYFEQRPFAEIGAALHLSEDAARMRVERALDKLHALLARRGITSTTAALALALQGNVVASVPAGLAAAVGSGALGAAATSGSVAAAGVFFTTMASGSFFSALAVGAAIAALTAMFYTRRQQADTEAALAEARQQHTAVEHRLTEATQRTAAAIQETDVLRRALASQTEVAPAPASTAGARAGDPIAANLQAGRDFLAEHPEARRMVEDVMRAAFDQQYGAPLRSLGLTPEEIDRIAAEASKHSFITMAVDDATFAFGSAAGGKSDEAERCLLGLLGEERFRRLQDARLSLMAKAVVKTVASAAFDSDVPLTPTQATALSAIIVQHRSVQAPDGALTRFALDWPAITREAGGVLLPPQRALFETALKSGAPATQSFRIPPP